MGVQQSNSSAKLKQVDSTGVSKNHATSANSGQAAAEAAGVRQAKPGSQPPRSPHPASATYPPRKHTLARWLFWSFTFVITTTISATVGATLALVTPLSPWMVPWDKDQKSVTDLWRNGFLYRVSRPIHILVMGIDRVPGAPSNSAEVFSGRSDTMLLLRIDPTDNSVSLLSIPRDTQVEIPEAGIGKINSANELGGPALTARVVSKTLNDVPIDRYVRVSTDAFRELVDLLGGIDVYVPKPMSYVDYTQKLKIDLAQGWQTLNGSQAEQFARFRHDELGDIGRVQRQQALIKSLRERLTNPMIIPRLPEIIRLMSKYVDTNLSLEEMLALMNFGLKLDRDNFKMVMLPGRFSSPGEYAASYWIMDEAGRDRVLQKYFKAGSAYSAVEDQAEASSAIRNLRIAVQNASGKPHVSSRIVAYLEKQGFRNIYMVEDWSDPQRETQIIVQQGDLEGATAVKKALGGGHIEAASIGDLESDITIRVGEDFSSQ